MQGAIVDYSEAIAVNPQDAVAYVDRASVWQALGNASQMCADLGIASRLGNLLGQRYFKQLCQSFPQGRSRIP